MRAPLLFGQPPAKKTSAKKSTSSEKAETKLRAAFAKFDLNGDGVLTLPELRAVLTHPGGGQPMAEAQIQKLFKTMDVDGDGKVEVLVSSGDHGLFCLDWRGRLEWRYPTDLRLMYPPTIADVDRDGKTDIWGIIHWPLEFDPNKTYPVVENIYAGPHGHHVPKSFRTRYRHQHRIADAGMIVVQIDGMGTAWRSKTFHDVFYL